jgi:hypothetical protein
VQCVAADAGFWHLADRTPHCADIKDRKRGHRGGGATHREINKSHSALWNSKGDCVTNFEGVAVAQVSKGSTQAPESPISHEARDILHHDRFRADHAGKPNEVVQQGISAVALLACAVT